MTADVVPEAGGMWGILSVEYSLVDQIIQHRPMGEPSNMSHAGSEESVQCNEEDGTWETTNLCFQACEQSIT